MGDSIVNHVEWWKLSKNVDRKHKVYVRSSSARVKCMKGYVKSCIRENNPDHRIIHVGTNELNSERQGNMIAKSITDAAKCIKSSGVPSTPAQSQEVHISETNDLNTAKETNQNLKCFRIKNLKKLIIGQLNINSLRNKFDLLTYQIKDNKDILMITETKLE